MSERTTTTTTTTTTATTSAATGTAPRNRKDYLSGLDPIWCPGCGDFGVLSGVSEVFAELNWDPKDVVIVSGIGCSGRFPAFLHGYGFHGVHGRALPIATGVALANPKLKVLVVGGDGDGLSIGAGHFPHAARRNVNLTYLMLDNEIYGLTKGQVSPTTTDMGLAKKALSSPYGAWERPVNAAALALSYHASYVGRAYSAKRKEMTYTLTEAFQHEGFSFVHIVSPCTTFYDSYKTFTPRVTPVPDDHNVLDLEAAMRLATDPERIYLGTLYHEEGRPTLTELFEHQRQMASAGKDLSLADVFESYC